jgi:hypothetical protein
LIAEQLLDSREGIYCIWNYFLAMQNVESLNELDVLLDLDRAPLMLSVLFVQQGFNGYLSLLYVFLCRIHCQWGEENDDSIH